MNIKQLISTAALATLAFVPGQTSANRCLSDESYGAMSYIAIAGKTAIRSTASIRSAYQSQST